MEGGNHVKGLSKIILLLSFVFSLFLVGCESKENKCEKLVNEKYGERAGEVPDAVQNCIDGNPY